MPDDNTTPLNYNGSAILARLEVRSDKSKKTGNAYTMASVYLNLGDDGEYPLPLAYLDERSIWALRKAIKLSKERAAQPSDKTILDD